MEITMFFEPSGFAGGHSQIAKDLNGDGTVDMGIKMSVSAVTGAKSYLFKIDEYQPDGTTLVDTYYEPSKKTEKKYGPVIAGHVYKVSAASVSFNGVEGAFSATTSITPTGKTTAPTAPAGTAVSSGVMSFQLVFNASADLDYYNSEVYYNSGTTPSAGQAPFFTIIQAENIIAQGFTFYVPILMSGRTCWMRHVNTSGIKSAWVNCGTFDVTELPTILISPNSVSSEYDVVTATSVALSAATTTQIQSIGSIDLTNAYAVMLYWEFTNNDGAFGRNFDVTLFDGATQIMLRSGLNVSDQGPLNGMFMYTGFTASSGHTIALKALCASATHIKAARLNIIVFKR